MWRNCTAPDDIIAAGASIPLKMLRRTISIAFALAAAACASAPLAPPPATGSHVRTEDGVDPPAGGSALCSAIRRRRSRPPPPVAATRGASAGRRPAATASGPRAPAVGHRGARPSSRGTGDRTRRPARRHRAADRRCCATPSRRCGTWRRSRSVSSGTAARWPRWSRLLATSRRIVQGGAAEALGLIGDASAADAVGRLASPDRAVGCARRTARRRCGRAARPAGTAFRHGDLRARQAQGVRPARRRGARCRRASRRYGGGRSPMHFSASKTSARYRRF